MGDNHDGLGDSQWAVALRLLGVVPAREPKASKVSKPARQQPKMVATNTLPKSPFNPPVAAKRKYSPNAAGRATAWWNAPPGKWRDRVGTLLEIAEMGDGHLQHAAELVESFVRHDMTGPAARRLARAKRDELLAELDRRDKAQAAGGDRWWP